MELPLFALKVLRKLCEQLKQKVTAEILCSENPTPEQSFGVNSNLARILKKKVNMHRVL